MMGEKIIAKLEKEFIFWKKKLFVLSMWKLTLGYGINVFSASKNEGTSQQILLGAA
jgi:hypothetical protein